MENKVENLIVEWLKSGNENATNLAHKICVLFSISNTEGELCKKCYDTQELEIYKNNKPPK